METAHHLRFYQAQYQPSFSIDADQAKVDDYLALGVDALNTPNIDPDFFNEGNLFSSEKVHHHHNPLKSSKIDPLLGSSATSEDIYNLGSSSTMISGSGNFGGVQSAVQQMSSIQMPSTSNSSYSPQQQLEISSQIININSPEMMLSSSSSSTSSSSPNNSKSYLDSSSNGSYLGNIEDDPTFYSQVAEYEQLAFYGSPEGSGFISSQHSAPNSRSSSISSGSGCEGATISNGYEYLLSDCLTTSEPITTATTSSTSPSNASSSPSNSLTNSRLAPSPAGSHYSSDSASSKTFTNLDAVQHLQQQQILASQQQQMISIKQEPVDSAIYQPTVIEEFEQQTLGGQQQMYSQQPIDSYSTINTAELAYYCTPQQNQYNSQQLPSTVSSALLLQPHMQQQTIQTTHQTTGRKRNSAAAFSSAASTASSSSSASTSAGGATATNTSTSSSSKKPRMTKREKQKMMESDIGKFETENRDLRQSIDLLERQIAFCKRFLSENVAPVIQRQQQNGTSTVGNGQFSSQMMIAVSEM